MSSWVVLGLVVRQVSSSWVPVQAEHLQGFFTSGPEEAHVPRLASLALHVFVAHTVGCGVVGLDGCFSLKVAHLD